MLPVLQLEMRCLFQQPCTTVSQTIGGSESFLLLLFFSLFSPFTKECVCLSLSVLVWWDRKLQNSTKTLFKKRLYKKWSHKKNTQTAIQSCIQVSQQPGGVDVWMRLYQILTDHWKCSFSKCLTEVGAGESVKRERERERKCLRALSKHVPRDQTRY